MRKNKEKAKKKKKKKKKTMWRDNIFVGHQIRVLVNQKIGLQKIYNSLSKDFEIEVFKKEGIDTILVDEKEEKENEEEKEK